MQATFLRACTRCEQFPESDLPEVAFVGRSNCGKSSLINAVSNHSKLARTSSSPGRTREIVFFHVHLAREREFHLVDLPGYGYAKASHDIQQGWNRLATDYIDRRDQLRLVLLLNDLRRLPQDEERDMLAWCRQRQVPAWVVLTKADQVPKNRRFKAAQDSRRALGMSDPPIVISGRDREAVSILREKLAVALPPSLTPRQ